MFTHGAMIPQIPIPSLQPDFSSAPTIHASACSGKVNLRPKCVPISSR
jgi:hypothetical protein